MSKLIGFFKTLMEAELYALEEGRKTWNARQKINHRKFLITKCAREIRWNVETFSGRHYKAEVSASPELKNEVLKDLVWNAKTLDKVVELESKFKKYFSK